MSENCSGNCESCGSACGEKKSFKDFLEAPNPRSSIGKVIGVISGKGGVGKSLVTAMLAAEMIRRGKHSAVLDADVTGPSIPKVFGLTEKATGDRDGTLYPVVTKTGIDVMSVNLLLPDETLPVVWRGPVISNVVKQFWKDVVWQDVDYLFVDMPPGTGDVPLTVFQSIPLDGIVIVTTPQDLVSMIVGKAVKMAQMMDIPVLGLVENMSYFECPDCGSRFSIFGDSKLEQVAVEHGLTVLDRIPIRPEIASACDKGDAESIPVDFLEKTIATIESL